MDLKKIKVCIFDVNGVLIDSNLANAKAMGKAFSDDPVMQDRIAEFYLTLTGIDRGKKIRRVQAHFFGGPLGEDEFQFDPSTCVFIGDGKGDLSAARYTRVPFVAIDPDTGEFEGEDGFDGPYKTLAEWGKEQLAL
jgi:phosphoglycolate phosphatase-like HAD superfamily hydrolase